jgi:3-hydroxyisobutyrate dehydrogenase
MWTSSSSDWVLLGVLVLADRTAIDAAVGRGTLEFVATIADHAIVPRGTAAPEYSRRLEAVLK